MMKVSQPIGGPGIECEIVKSIIEDTKCKATGFLLALRSLINQNFSCLS